MLSNTATPIYYGRFRDDVIRGKIVVNEYVSMQMNRIDDMIRNPNYYYDDDAINGFISFCENEMTLTDGSDLDLLDSFKLWAEDLFSWFEFVTEEIYNPVKGTREIVEIKRRVRNKQYLIVARGNAKSLYATLIHAYGLIVDPDTTEQITTSPTMRQSEEIMNPFSTAITRARGPLFKMMTEGNIKARNGVGMSKLATTKKGIENKATNSTLTIKPMSVNKLQGMKTKYNTVDEWLSGDTKEDVVGAIEQGASKIRDYVIVAVSSEGTVRDSIGDSIKMELVSILKGEYDDPHTSIWYYRLDDVSEVANPSMWVKACPNIGVTVTYDTYERDVLRAEHYPASRNDILAKRFGIPVEGHTYFFTYEETMTHPRQNFQGLECSMGMDASQGDDFWAFTWIFPLGNGRYGVRTRSYVSDIKYNRLPQATQYKYDQFVREGTLVIMKGSVLNWVDVFEDCMDYIYKNDWAVISFGFDPYNSKEFVGRWIDENGEMGVERVIQGAKTESVPLGELKNMAVSRELIFDEELMKYAMGNAIVLLDNNDNYKLSKKRSDEKIDNVAALMDAWVAFKRNFDAFLV